MTTPKRTVLVCLTLCLFLFATPTFALADDFRNEVIYQIVTDRFFDGNPNNNNPTQSFGLYDATRADFRKYWGGDFAGITQKIPYLQDMGVTAIWISPPLDNSNVQYSFGTGYHGYWTRDFKRPEEHFADESQSWDAFDAMVTAAHAAGIKVIVDFVPNHTSPGSSGEFGALYNNGLFLASRSNDPNGYFRNVPDISNFDDRYQIQYYQLLDLADLNSENGAVDAYLKGSMQQLIAHNVDGFRVDAIKHLTWGWEHSLVNDAHTTRDLFIFGEWFQGSVNDFTYPNSVDFGNRSGMSQLDFPHALSILNTFTGTGTFSQLDAVRSRIDNDFKYNQDLVTFIDNHDIPRFLNRTSNIDRLHQSLAYLMTMRGVPCIYYGTEQYLFNGTNGGNDPFNRPMMPGFSTTTTAYQTIQKLATLRKNNPALGYGTTTVRSVGTDTYVYERKFFGSTILVAINKNDTTPATLTNLTTALPAGAYTDYLNGLLNGSPLTVAAGTGGNNTIASLNLPAKSVSVWQIAEGAGTSPQLGAIGPTRGQAGNRISVSGRNFGATQGAVRIGEVAADIVSWSDTKITLTVPNLPSADYPVKVVRSNGNQSNESSFTILNAKLIPVTFTVNNADPTQLGDEIYVVGEGVELGNWNYAPMSAVGPMNTPNYPNWFITTSVPAGKTLRFKFIKIKSNGQIQQESGFPHTYTVPASGVGAVTVNWTYPTENVVFGTSGTATRPKS